VVEILQPAELLGADAPQGDTGAAFVGEGFTEVDLGLSVLLDDVLDVVVVPGRALERELVPGDELAGRYLQRRDGMTLLSIPRQHGHPESSSSIGARADDHPGNTPRIVPRTGSTHAAGAGLRIRRI